MVAEKVLSDGTRLEVTPLEAPSRNGETERADKDWKEYYYKMTKDGSEALTWTDFEMDCDGVRWKMPFWNTEEPTLGSLAGNKQEN